MLWGITVVLLMLWLLGFVAFHSVGAWVHVLLVLAVVSVVINLIREAGGVAAQRLVITRRALRASR